MKDIKGYFDFWNLTAEAVSKLATPEDKLSARSRIGHQQFAKACKNAGLKLLRAGEILDLALNPNALVIGVATWSNADMAFLDIILRYLRLREQVFVFDVDICLSLENIVNVMPQTSYFRETPVIAEYADGLLVQRAEGKTARSSIESKIQRNQDQKSHR